eukprot:CAMPEP_0172151750 /NCGR_PEP_ID=MMETSP1050-20130122/419_1 /TAXON_ID=233186 /ORGANISM="Cryptomonas curvata, Strain CCAP979/52" /LENGTH=246 /DNA_ID=CAMNT_0012819923 /DNA_START=286 /DNA_END=1026 /DNA_ORIENTATION=+
MVVSGVTLARAKRKTRQSSIYTQQNTECDDRQRNHIDSQRSDQGKSEKQPYIDWTGANVTHKDRVRSHSCSVESSRPLSWAPSHTDPTLLVVARHNPPNRTDPTRHGASSGSHAVAATRKSHSFRAKSLTRSALSPADSRRQAADRAAVVAPLEVASAVRGHAGGREHGGPAANPPRGSWTTRLRSPSLADLLGFLRNPQDELVRSLAGRRLDDQFREPPATAATAQAEAPASCCEAARLAAPANV